MQDLKWVSTTQQSQWQEKQVGKSDSGANLAVSGSRHQTWDGFGGCFNELGWIALSDIEETKRREIIQALFDPKDGCRFNLCRLPIGASDYAAEWYSHNETDGDFEMKNFSIERDEKILIPYIKEAMKLRPDMKLFASPWSPPTWFKFPKAYNYGTMMWDKKYLDAYALYFVKFVQAYKEAGISINQVHVQNEPLADQKFPSCVWTGQQMTDFIRDHLGPAFKTAGLDCEIWFGTLNTDDYNGYPNTVLSDPEAAQYVSGIGFQWSGKGAIQRTSIAWPETGIMQTENECGDGKNSWVYARYVYELLWHYITNGAHGYVYWNMVLEPGGLSTWGWHQNAMVTVDRKVKSVTYNPEFFVMKHFSRFVDKGAVRLGLTGAWAGNAVAFENPDGGRVVVVGNPWAEAREFVFEGISATLEGYSFNTFVID